MPLAFKSTLWILKVIEDMIDNKISVHIDAVV